MNPNDDPTAELYKMLDEAGLTPGPLMNIKKPHAQIVNEIRSAVVMRLRSYITRYGQTQFNLGVKKGKIDANIQKPEPKRQSINVDDGNQPDICGISNNEMEH